MSCVRIIYDSSLFPFNELFLTSRKLIRNIKANSLHLSWCNSNENICSTRARADFVDWVTAEGDISDVSITQFNFFFYFLYRAENSFDIKPRSGNDLSNFRSISKFIKRSCRFSVSKVNLFLSRRAKNSVWFMNQIKVTKN